MAIIESYYDEQRSETNDLPFFAISPFKKNEMRVYQPHIILLSFMPVTLLLGHNKYIVNNTWRNVWEIIACMQRLAGSWLW